MTTSELLEKDITVIITGEDELATSTLNKRFAIDFQFFIDGKMVGVRFTPHGLYRALQSECEKMGITI